MIELTIPDEHIVHHVVIEADESMSVPFCTRVFVLRDREMLRAATSNERACAHSITFEEIDGAGIGAIVLLNLDDLHLSLVAHEIMHVALSRAAYDEPADITREWLLDHPESIAELVGNLSALIWYSLPATSED